MSATEQIQIAKVLERAEIAEARAQALRSTLEKLVKYVSRVGGFMSSEDQRLLREARELTL